MSIEYNVYQSGLRIEVFPKGVLDAQKTIDYFGRLSKDKKIKQGATEVVFFKHVTDFNISHSESRSIPISYQEQKVTQKIGNTIFVCETDLAYGIGRMLQAFHGMKNPKHKVMVVRSESELEKKKADRSFKPTA